MRAVDLIWSCFKLHFAENFTFILSLSEAKALKLAKRSPEDFIQHNKRQLSRIYPAGSRVGSTNYDPVPFWIVGCQVGQFPSERIRRFV